ncbi:hypothetical protein D8674_022456 [Pyrus ussuriensis x Pyrus communis]|uniref:Uncharacterized protein n=1 Tax=Pyrus ussuriensis x Pyrus communis TaxID=2448454 RepID=A0A5N5GKI9_9ROSA|nr:hypothetical protein D8674_022456 [Pyrus ussuriensis x Pyrus communis]
MEEGAAEGRREMRESSLISHRYCHTETESAKAPRGVRASAGVVAAATAYTEVKPGDDEPINITRFLFFCCICFFIIAFIITGSNTITTNCN